jgi:hypothetical protein
MQIIEKVIFLFKEKSMRKIIAAILSALCVSCLAFAFGCNDEPSYYKLTFQTVDGVTYNFYGMVDGEEYPLENGAQVKEGSTVYFTYSEDDDVLGEAVVKANDSDELTPNSDGVYSFQMNSDMSIAVTGLVKQQTCVIDFEKGDNRVKYYVDGVEKDSISVKAGDTVEFTLWVSVYYNRSKYTVLANTTVVKETDGVYKFTAVQDTNITVENLSLDETFIDRGAGAGTKANPYQLSRPIDLYYLADLVNDDFWSGAYARAYYILTDDIDMEGEQLYIIGDGTTDYAFFCGDFNGNGKTISNYYIDDTIIEQSAYTEVFMPYIGLFGEAMATTSRAPEIYDLNLADFTIDIDAASSKSTFCAGGIVGLGIGANIRNCTVSGKITARADVNYFGYIGGVVGFQQSAYVSDSLRYYSAVVGCVTNVNISGNAGYVHSIGGISGYVMSHEEQTAAYVLNCGSTGTLSGAFYTGGIAGMVSAYSSVKNSYFAGDYVDAVSRVSKVYGDDTYCYAYSGGIAGYADYDSIVSGCFSTATVANKKVGATATESSAYAITGDIVGGKSGGGSSNVESSPALITNNYANSSVPSSTVLKDTLGWIDSDWSFESKLPQPKAISDTRNITITLVNALDQSDVKTIKLSEYVPISVWYGEENGIAQFISNGSNRSYGYYFANDNGTLSDKVPYSYILTGGETLYYKLVDYSAVAGEYYANYAGTGVDGGNVVLTLGVDGTLNYSEGANQYVSYYIYDGTQITLFDCPALIESDDDDGDYFTSGVATLSDGVLTISNGVTYKNSTALKAIKKMSNFVYGYYRSQNGDDVDVYYFNPNGTGTRDGVAFTYVATSSAITVNIGNVGYDGVVDANGYILNVGEATLEAYDAFEGVWEKSATTHKQYTFDGFGKWSYKYFGYDNKGAEKVISSDSGTYTYNSSDETIILSDGKVVGFDENGYLVVKDGDFAQTYYKKSSVSGTWRFAYRKEAIQITFSGIGTSGYGEALVDYESLTSTIAMTYDIRTTDGVDYIYLFYQNSNYAILTYSSTDSTLVGSIYSAGTSSIVSNAVFCLYDDYKGSWIGEEWTSVEFNGLGSYKMSGSATTLSVSGTVRINGNTFNYTLDDSTMDGSIKIGDTTYKIAYNDEDDTITVTNGSDSFTLSRHDSWYTVKLEDESGNLYTFNGGGLLTNGGKLTIGETEYVYKVEGSKAVVYSDGNKVGEIAIIDNDYVYTLVDQTSKTLTISTTFTGSWAVSGAPDSLLVIGKIGANNKAEGTYLGNAVTFTYNAASNYLSFEYNSRTIYVMSMNAKGNTELALSYYSNTLYGFTCCVSTSNLDGFVGTYTKEGYTMTLDGLGNSFYGKGTIVVTNTVSGNSETLYYTINKFGMPMVSGGAFILKPVSADTEGAYVNGNIALIEVERDILYAVTATDKNKVAYTFNGVGEVICDDNTYEYTVVSNDTLNLIVTLKITMGSTVVDAELDYSSTDYKLTIKA